MVFVRLSLILLLAVVLRQCLPPAIEDALARLQPDSPTADTALIARGVEVYRSQYCGTCHALAAANTRGTFGPPHDGVGLAAQEHLADPGYRGSATTPAEYLRESIITPEVYIVPGYERTNHHMPPYGHLPPEDIDAIVAMLLQQTRPG